MSNYPTLHIVTGPPGSGKTTKANSFGLPVYDNDLGNLRDWISNPPPSDAVLTVTAPTNRQKSYWVSIAKQNGWVPKLYTIWISRMEAFQRMKARSGLSPTQKNQSDKWVVDWFKKYQRHQAEERITNARS